MNGQDDRQQLAGRRAGVRGHIRGANLKPGGDATEGSREGHHIQAL